MSLVVRLMGVPVLSLGFEKPSDDSEQVLRIDNTGGLFELAVEDDSPDYDEEEYEDQGFGFGVHVSGPPGAATLGGGVRGA